MEAIEFQVALTRDIALEVGVKSLLADLLLRFDIQLLSPPQLVLLTILLPDLGGKGEELLSFHVPWFSRCGACQVNLCCICVRICKP